MQIEEGQRLEKLYSVWRPPPPPPPSLSFSFSPLLNSHLCSIMPGSAIERSDVRICVVSPGMETLIGKIHESYRLSRMTLKSLKQKLLRFLSLYCRHDQLVSSADSEHKCILMLLTLHSLAVLTSPSFQRFLRLLDFILWFICDNVTLGATFFFTRQTLQITSSNIHEDHC